MEGADYDWKRYIKLALVKENLQNYEITLTSGTEKSDGYAGIITFATVCTTSQTGVKRNIEIAVKCSNKHLVQMHRRVYEREVYFYEVILPIFTKFQEENNIENIFNSVPKCYKSISETSMVVIVMENLRKSGYMLYDRKKPLDINHQKLVLRQYGKLHAISFALKDKRRQDFEKLVTDFDDIMLTMLTEPYRERIQHEMKRACDILEKIGDVEMYKTCMEIFRKGIDQVFEEVLKSVEPKSAILHGDCWNNNFVYKYQNENNHCPSKVAIIDWQVSRLHSPVLDLSLFIYMASSEEQLEQFDELLETYYDSFSLFLKEFGCDPEKLFSYSMLQCHWKKYGIFGMLMVTSFLHMTICDEEESPEINDGTNMGDNITNVSITNESEFKKRLFAVISHCCRYNGMK